MCILHELFAPKRCIYDFKLSYNEFNDIMNSIVDNYNKNIIEPGEYVGIIAA
jgi:hypothetical protein